MTAHSLRLDHLVISARTLDEGTQYVADTLGVAPAGGGAHPLMRTHNRLLNLWGGVYLEVIAIDPEAAEPASGVDAACRACSRSTPRRPQARLAERPVSVALGRARRAAEGLAALAGAVSAAHPAGRADDAAAISPGACQCRTTAPSPAGKAPATASLPSLIQWDTPHHPSAVLPETELALKVAEGGSPASRDDHGAFALARRGAPDRTLRSPTRHPAQRSLSRRIRHPERSAHPEIVHECSPSQ